jgi:hypothetical protein
MSIVKFQNFSGIKNEKHTPRAIADVDMKNGYAVVIKFEDGIEKACLPTGDEVKGDLWFVHNTITTPELDNYDDFVIKAGKPVRAFNFENSKREIIEVSGDLVTTKVAINDVLVANKKGLYEKITDATGYKISLKVVGNNTVGGKGYDCVIVTE